jgi:excisionase family DNA binding protein
VSKKTMNAAAAGRAICASPAIYAIEKRNYGGVMKQLVTTKDAAAQLGCSEAAIRKWIYQRRLKPVRVGRLVRLRAEDIQRVAEEGLAPAAA